MVLDQLTGGEQRLQRRARVGRPVVGQPLQAGRKIPAQRLLQRYGFFPAARHHQGQRPGDGRGARFVVHDGPFPSLPLTAPPG